MADSAIARRRLEEHLKASTPRTLTRPHAGWIRAIRESLGMSAADLGRRMGITQQAVAEMERGELRSTIQMDTLERAAAAMHCSVVYAVVPRTSLDQIVADRSRAKAKQILDVVGHHSRLEDQSISPAELEQQIDELAADLAKRRGLWRDSDLSQ